MFCLYCEYVNLKGAMKQEKINKLAKIEGQCYFCYIQKQNVADAEHWK